MLPLFALALPVLLLFCGLAVDIGLMESRALSAQQAADSAALSGELEAERGGDWASVARSSAALNGFTDGANSTTVTVTAAPTRGPYAGAPDALQVTVTQQAPTIFLSSLGGSTVSATAIALIPPCVYLTGSGTTLTASSAGITASCPVYANGAVQLDRASSLMATALNLTGTSAQSSFAGSAFPAPRFSASTLTDPLATLAEPQLPPCTATSFAHSGGSVTLHPGVFCKGMTLSQANVTLTPGLYVFTGGAHWSGSVVQGTGVTLLFTSGNGVPTGQFLIDGGSTVTLSAPLDSSCGGIPAVLLFGSRTWSSGASNSNAQDIQITSSTVQADGILYLPAIGLQLTGASLTGTRDLALDLQSLTCSSCTLRLSGDFSAVPSGSPFRPLGGLVQ